MAGPGLAVVLSSALLALDAIFLFDRTGMLLTLLLAGVGLPALAIWNLYLRLSR